MRSEDEKKMTSSVLDHKDRQGLDLGFQIQAFELQTYLSESSNIFMKGPTAMS